MVSSRFGAIYIRSVQIAGVLVLAGSAADLWLYPPGWYWLGLTAVAAFSGSYAVRIPGVVVRLSVSEPIVFLSTILFGPTPGTITAAVDAFAMSLRLPKRLRTPHRIFFNVGGLALSVLPSALLYFQLADIDLRSPVYGGLETFVGPLYVFAVCVFLINSSLVAVAVGVERRLSAIFVWRTQFFWLSASYLASAAIAAILVVLTDAVDAALLAVLLPLVAVSILAVRNTLGRLDDTNRHLSEVNSLYLSTIETLAMAIDAKDQVTHGHIRRVQRFAVGLARALGVTEERQLRAIEAAALLHDMGKLAIPEFILNKPGKLTTKEFSVMKTHAAVGADLLSSIQFPYPVVPIVRHHHENWDGSGYPDGIRGSDIPIGARILSVVDCYDALTSDRPYRPALPPAEALEILAQRRGRMYDPLIVDTFVREHSSLCAAASFGEVPGLILANQQDAQSGQAVHALIAQDTTQPAPIETLRLLSALSPLPEGPPFRVVCRQLVDDLRQVAAFETAAIFLLDESSSDAECVFADGGLGKLLVGARIPVARKLTGWVAAHQTAVWNSDAALDLSPTSLGSTVSLGSSLPLQVGETLVGVMTLYGRTDQEISVGQRRALESLLPTIARRVGESLMRPAMAVDGNDPETRAAALAALDALLSHHRQQEGIDSGPGILALSVSSKAPEGPRRQTTEDAAAELIAILSPRQSQNRCVIALGPAHVLLCSLDGAPVTSLQLEAAVAAGTRALANWTVECTAIRTPLELQSFARTAAEQLVSAAPLGRSLRVH